MFSLSGHHAYCIEGVGRNGAEQFVGELCGIFGIERNNPDLIFLSVQKFGIDEARDFRAFAANRAIGDGKKIFVLASDSITNEAQNALLKTFEEPSLETKFFLLVKTADMLLPTLRSRVEIVKWTPSDLELNTECLKPATLGVQEFLAAALSERLARAREIGELLKKEKMTRGEAVSFILDIIARARGESFPQERAVSLNEALLAEKYSYDRSSSLKILIEHLAIVLPKIN